MNITIIGRACAAAVITLTGISIATTPASAEEAAPSCDPAVVQAALTQAEADARAAQKAYVTHTRTSMKALVKQHQGREAAEARSAAKEAARLTAAAAKDPALRDAAKAARETARAEAKEAAEARRASFRALVREVKAQRAVLRTAWDSAKKVLQDARQVAEDCAAQPPAPEAPATT